MSLRNLHKIKSNLHIVDLDSLWKQDFYSHRQGGVTPCNIEGRSMKMPFRLMYEGMFNDNGLILDFTVGVMSDEDSEYYEFFVEDYSGGSSVECFKNFDDAVRRFSKLTNVRKPYIYIDDKDGNAVRIDYKVGPHSTVYKHISDTIS